MAEHPTFLCVLGAAVTLACFLPCQPARKPPFLRPTVRTWIGTDDGPRAFWGYAFALRYFPTVLAPPDWLHPLVTDSHNILLVAPYNGWVAGPLSQRFLMYMVRHCAGVTITPGTCVGSLSGKTIVITDPAQREDNLSKHFGTGRNSVVQRNVPLDLGPVSEAIVKALSSGPATPEELAKQLDTAPETLSRGAANLRRVQLLRISESGQYPLTCPIASAN